MKEEILGWIGLELIVSGYPIILTRVMERMGVGRDEDMISEGKWSDELFWIFCFKRVADGSYRSISTVP